MALHKTIIKYRDRFELLNCIRIAQIRYDKTKLNLLYGHFVQRIIDDHNVYSVSCVVQVPRPGVDSDESQTGSGRRHSQDRVRTNQEAGGDTARTG
jgi:hypothetical protein